jgi:hypothetical protein
MRRLITLLVLITGCTDPSAEPLSGAETDIIGSWRMRDSDESVVRNDSTFSSFYDAKINFYPAYALTFVDASTGIADGKNFTYQRQGNILTIDLDGKSYSWKVSSSEEGKINFEASKEDLAQVITPAEDYQKIQITSMYKRLELIQKDFLPEGYYRPTEEIYYNLSGRYFKQKYSYSDEGYVQKKIWSSGDIGGVDNITSVINTTFSHRMMGKKVLFFKHQPYIGTTSEPAPANTSGNMHVNFDIISKYEYSENFPRRLYYTYDAQGRLETEKVQTFPYLGPNDRYDLTTYTYEGNQPWNKAYHQQYISGILSEKTLSQVRIFHDFESRTRIPHIYTEGKSIEKNFLVKEIANSETGPATTIYAYEIDDLQRVKVRKTYDNKGILRDSTVYIY